MRGDGVPVAPGMLHGEAVAAGVMKAEGAIPGLFQETGLQDPQGVVHLENQWRHHGYHAYPGVDAQAASAAAVRGGLLIALWADIFAAEEVEAGSDPRGHLGVTWGVYLCAGKPPLADIILSHPPDLTRCDSVIGRAIPAMSGHIQYRGTASGDLYIGISGINRVLLS